jgi:ankyrin repeat protein
MQDESTALYLASHAGHAALVSMLLERLANINAARNVSVQLNGC